MKVPDKVKSKLQELPDKPGIYMMRDKHGRVIYVGKAVSLRKRVQQYFRQGTLRSADPKTRSLIRSIASFDFLEVRNEAEATLTESKFIKEYRPHYNVLMKDDKRFLLLCLKEADPFPRFTTSRIRRDDGRTYFGPYVDGGAARAAREFVERTYGLRVCRPRKPGPEDHKHCVNDIVRYCSAPCMARVSQEEYRERVHEAMAFLRGERPEQLKKLEEEMNEQSRLMHFERAAELRDILILLRNAVKQRASGRSTFVMKQEDARAGVTELQTALALEKPPQVIECYDISNISGTHAVGSMVCAVDGMPRRNRYRLFRIKTVEGIDDPGMMAEVMHRRFSRMLKENGEPPDLVLADGGITQLRATRKALAELGLSGIPTAGLAKRFEEVYCGPDGVEDLVRLPLDSPGLKVLQRIRDEAHRFALTYHRKLRESRIRDSVLDEVSGIGKKRKELLLQHFGSVTRLRKATVEDLAKVPGIGSATARMILQALEKGGAAAPEEVDGAAIPNAPAKDEKI